LDWGVDVWGFEGVNVWGFEGVNVWGSEKRVRLFELGYARVDVWGKFMGVCEWYDGCKGVLFIFKLLNVTLQIYPCLLNFFNNEMSYFCLKINNFHIFYRFKN